MTAPKAYLLVFLIGQFTSARCSFFVSGCFGSQCQSTTHKPLTLPDSVPLGVKDKTTYRRVGFNRPGSKLYDYGRSAAPLQQNKDLFGQNVPKLSLPFFQSAQINLPAVSLDQNVIPCPQCLLGGGQVGPVSNDRYMGYWPKDKLALKLEDKYVELRPLPKGYVEDRPTVHRVLYPRVQETGYSVYKSPEVVRRYTLQTNDPTKLLKPETDTPDSGLYTVPTATFNLQPPGSDTSSHICSSDEAERGRIPRRT